MDRAEVVAGCQILCGGDRAAKLRLAFQCYDTDGDGHLSKEEIGNLLKASVHEQKRRRTFDVFFFFSSPLHWLLCSTSHTRARAVAVTLHLDGNAAKYILVPLPVEVYGKGGSPLFCSVLL